MGKILAVLAVLSLISNQTLAAKKATATDNAESSCEATLTGLGLLWGSAEGEASGESHTDRAFAAALEEHSLSELADLAVKHPSIMMTAAQRIYSIILKAGSKKLSLRGKGEVTVYNLFSEPNKYNNGKFIVGHERELESFVEAIKGAIRGSVKVPFFEGPAGTGKTLLQEILRHALYYTSLHEESSYYYTVEWINLEDIPGLEMLPDGKYRAPLHDSPYAILPSSAQERLLQHVRNNFKDTRVGKIEPFAEPDGHNRQIRKKIVEMYAAQKKQQTGNGVLTDKEIIEALDKHVVIRRQILGRDGSAPILDAQGREYDPGALFVSKDPLLSNTVEGRTSNPLAWTYGLLPKANGSAMFLDEFPRNVSQLRDMFLRLFESHEIQYGGSPAIPLDAFIIAAGNHESMEKLFKEGGAKAHVDRVNAIPFNWSIYPHEIALTQLLMYKEVYARELGSEEGPQKVDLLYLFPRALAGEDILTADGRYEIWLGEGDSMVHLSPHALMFASMITAATRLHIDGAEALSKENHFTYRGNVYNSPIERLKYLLGRDNHLSAGEIEDLEQASILNKEGHFGLSMRDANEWLSQAASRAAATTGDLTPRLIVETFRDLLDAGKLKSMGGDDKTRKRWKLYADMIAMKLILDNLQADVMRSLGDDKTLVNNTYDEVILELIAAGKGQATYVHPRIGTAKKIDVKRLKDVAQIYSELHGEALDIEQMSTMFMAAEASRSEKGQVVRDQNLYDAITKYFAEKASDNIDLATIIQIHQSGEASNTQAMGRYRNLVENMKRLGYSEEGMVEALIYVEELESRVAEARMRAQGQK